MGGMGGMPGMGGNFDPAMAASPPAPPRAAAEVSTSLSIREEKSRHLQETEKAMKMQGEEEGKRESPEALKMHDFMEFVPTLLCYSGPLDP